MTASTNPVGNHDSTRNFHVNSIIEGDKKATSREASSTPELADKSSATTITIRQKLRKELLTAQTP